MLSTVGALIASLLGGESLVTLKPVQGISVFAVAYLDAQLVERLIEPLTERERTEPAKAPSQPGIMVAEAKKASRIQSFYHSLKIWYGFPLGDPDRTRHLRKKTRSDTEDEELAKLEAKRAISIWGVASLLGIVICFITIGLFEQAGVVFNSVIASYGSSTITGHSIDAILSGMIVGGGTKPLHDLIGYIEKSSKSNGQKS